MMKRKQVALGLIAAVLTIAAPAWASFPGENGRIVFQSSRTGPVPPELYSMKPDATDVRRLTWNSVPDQVPRVSPDGARIVFARTVAGIDQDIWIINADGSGERQLTSGPARDDLPVFTQDGARVVFQRVAGAQTCPCELRIVGADGAGERLLDTGPGNAANPDVSANGKLAFAGDRDGTRSIYVTNLRGGPVKRATQGPAAFGDFRPRWSPRGNDLVFMRNALGSLASLDLWTVHQDGTDLRRLTATERVEEYPQWSPDGKRIVFTVLDPGPPFGGRLHTIDATGGDEQVLPQIAAPFVEDFGDGRRDGSFWHELFDPGATIGEVGGALDVAIAGDAVPGGPFNHVSAHWGSQCELRGDFDYQVDYELLTWPLQGGFFATLSAFFADAAITRSSGSFAPHQFYGGFVPGGAFNFVPTEDLAGTLRLIRIGDTIFAYASGADSTWNPVFSAPGATGPSTIGIGLTTPAEQFGRMDGRVAFDDLRINSGEVSCPTWWRDTAPDWAVG